MGLGAPELLIILAVILLFFGAAKLPKLARSLGHAQKEYHEGVREAAESGRPAPAPEGQSPERSPSA